MSCCAEISQFFVNESVTNVTYAGQFGTNPIVKVWYNINNVYTNASTQIQMEGSPVNNIKISHGGPATGLYIIK